MYTVQYYVYCTVAQQTNKENVTKQTNQENVIKQTNQENVTKQTTLSKMYPCYLTLQYV